MRVLFIGDIVGRPGRNAIKRKVPELREALRVDAVVANGENAAGGAGLTGAIAREIRDCGVDAITLGDHLWDQRGFDSEIDGLDWVCRPVNLPKVCPGRTHLEIETPGGTLVVFTVLGRQFMKVKADCPLIATDGLLKTVEGKGAMILAEVHAEATSEKIALGWHLDGRVGLVVGTHTHVRTADYRILPRGTAYITDAGMTGPHASVLGREVEPVLASLGDGMPRRFPVAEEDVQVNGVVVDWDPETGRSRSIEPVSEALLL